jgi:cytochrome P450
MVDGVAVPRAPSSASARRREPRREALDDPERFDLFREPKQHMAFAYGPHTCLGMHLARMETRVVIDAVLDRLPNLRLDPDAEGVHVTGLTFRAPATLPVVFG